LRAGVPIQIFIHNAIVCQSAKKIRHFLVILAKLGWHFFGDKMARMAGPHATKGGYTWSQSINLGWISETPFFGHILAIIAIQVGT